VTTRTQSHIKTVKQQQERKPFEITFVLDVSGSMIGRGIDECVRGINSIVKCLRDVDKVSIRTFNNRIHDVMPLRTKAAHGGNHGIGRVASGVRAGGRTALWDAIASSVQKCNTEAPGVQCARKIFILTDGDDTCSARGRLQEARKLVQAPGYAVHICMIAVTNDMTSDTQHTLSTLGGKNCCYQYRSVSNASAIGEGFKFFSEKVLKLEVVTEQVVAVSSRTYTRPLHAKK
jgi:uncharacterized protein YegL